MKLRPDNIDIQRRLSCQWQVEDTGKLRLSSEMEAVIQPQAHHLAADRHLVVPVSALREAGWQNLAHLCRLTDALVAVLPCVVHLHPHRKPRQGAACLCQNPFGVCCPLQGLSASYICKARYLFGYLPGCSHWWLVSNGVKLVKRCGSKESDISMQCWRHADGYKFGVAKWLAMPRSVVTSQRIF